MLLKTHNLYASLGGGELELELVAVMRESENRQGLAR